MRIKRVLVPLLRDEVAPRFDLASEALVADVDLDSGTFSTSDYLLPHSSADAMCDLALRRDVQVVICGAVDEEYYHYLRWKRVEVLDNVAATAQDALQRFAKGALKAGDILFPREDGHAR